MARPKPAPSAVLQARPRPDHAFAPPTEPAPSNGEPATDSTDHDVTLGPSRTAATAASRADADAGSRNAGTESSRDAATAAEVLVKFSIRVAPDKHRHIKVTAAQQGMSIQDLAVTAISEYLERLGHPLP